MTEQHAAVQSLYKHDIPRGGSYAAAAHAGAIIEMHMVSYQEKLAALCST